MSEFGKVAVLFGGDSAEREVSLNSGNAVLKSLLEVGVDAHGFDPAQQALAELKHQNFDRALIALHGRGGEDGRMQGALELLKIPYTGSGVLGSALAMDKVRCKKIWKQLGLPTADYRVVRSEKYNQTKDQELQTMLAELGGLVFVKPCHEGSSIGMSKAATVNELSSALEIAFEYDETVLVESFINGKEYTVAILNDEILPSIHMETPRDFYDYQAKYKSSDTQYFCPSGLSEQMESELAELSLQAFAAVAASGWGRVDLIQDVEGQFYLLEVNTVPGMTETSLVPKAARVKGLSFSDLVLAILKTAGLDK